MSDDEFTQGVDSLKMTRVDWRWAAMKGFWDKESKQWNESAGGQAAYLLQKTKRMKKREERPHRSALRQAGPSSASRRLHGASLRSGIIEELPPRTADNWALSLSGASSRDLSSHTPDIPSLKGGMVVGGRGPEVQPDNVPNVLSSGFQPGVPALSGNSGADTKPFLSRIKNCRSLLSIHWVSSPMKSSANLNSPSETRLGTVAEWL